MEPYGTVNVPANVPAILADEETPARLTRVSLAIRVRVHRTGL